MPHGPAAGAAAAPPATTAALSSEPLAMWTRSDDKLLEMLIVRYFPPQWDMITSRLVGDKTPEQAYRRYERTVREVTHALQALRVETPREWDAQIVMAASSPPAERSPAVDMTVLASAGQEAAPVIITENKAGVPASCAASRSVKKRKRDGGKRKKPEKWTEQDHRRFLTGLEIYGEGNWKKMSSEYLTTKSATQIASHHQKFCIRLEQRKRKGCKRASIHDITEPTTSADGARPAAHEDELGTRVEPPEAPPGEQVESVEEFPGQYDLGTLFM